MIEQEYSEVSINDIIVTSSEVQIILGISRARLCQLKKTKKLVPIKKNIYLLSDILQRQKEQIDLRNKFYKTKGSE